MAAAHQSRQSGTVYGGLALGVVAVSFAALFIRLAQAPPLAIASYRLVLAALPVLVLAVWRRRRELRGLSVAERRAMLLSGLCLAGHFATWVASLKYASVASSVALVTTSPFFVAGFAFLFVGERTSRRMLVAISICLAGGFVIGAADLATGLRALYGDGLALAGAAFAGVYFALGRRVRSRVSLLAYVGIVYPLCAVVLLVLAIGARQPLSGFNGSTYLYLVLLAVVPQLLGHSSLNWALGYLSAPFVAISVLGEPILSTLLAVIFLAERPGPERIAGGVLILAGVYLALREERATARAMLLSAVSE
jgi:drug/metabolite transporter (DMT)-like permease